MLAYKPWNILLPELGIAKKEKEKKMQLSDQLIDVFG